MSNMNDETPMIRHRISSKAMKNRLPMAEIAQQLRKADSGRCTILSDLAAKMEEFTGGETCR